MLARHSSELKLLVATNARRRGPPSPRAPDASHRAENGPRLNPAVSPLSPDLRKSSCRARPVLASAKTFASLQADPSPGHQRRAGVIAGESSVVETSEA